VNSNTSNPLSNIPGIDSLLSTDAGNQLIKKFGHKAMVDTLRDQISSLRKEIQQDPTALIPDDETLLAQAETDLGQRNASSLKPVINLTGTVIHTNLGRSLLPRSAIEQMQLIGASASNLEFDLQTGKRGDRDTHTEQLLAELTGAEAATVVNNNAAAVLLVLNTLAKNKEVPVSRGELVEIGGSFRIPDIMSGSGCKLVEVGTTNRTHLKDYAQAINSETAMLMKVHTSNYEIQGYTKSVDEFELANLAREHKLPFVTDLGSGTLVDFEQLGLPPEPTVQQAITSGADLVTFSGDKLLGGPQAGIIVGSHALISQLKANPLKRALRVDKVTIAMLFEVLKLYRNPDTLVAALPTLRHLTRSVNEIERLAHKLVPEFAAQLGEFAEVSAVPCESQIGSGSLPTARLASWGVSITPSDTTRRHEQTLQLIIQGFRNIPIPVIGRVQDGTLIFDLRTLDNPEHLITQLSHVSIP